MLSLHWDKYKYEISKGINVLPLSPLQNMMAQCNSSKVSQSSMDMVAVNLLSYTLDLVFMYLQLPSAVDIFFTW
jgi:hypothetical protein